MGDIPVACVRTFHTPRKSVSTGLDHIKISSSLFLPPCRDTLVDGARIICLLSPQSLVFAWGTDLPVMAFPSVSSLDGIFFLVASIQAYQARRISTQLIALGRSKKAN